MICGRSGKKWKMAKAKRNIGAEIQQGLREIKRGEHGRVINVPHIASIRGRPAHPQAPPGRFL